MNILIDSYKNLDDPSFDKLYGRLHDNKIRYRRLPKLEKTIRTMLDKKFEEDYENLQRLTELDVKRYKIIHNIYYDNAYTMECLGYSTYSSKYSVILSLQDSLDYVLHKLCGADIKNIRRIPKYQIISRGILNMDYHILNDFSFGNIIGYDENLDNYLAEMACMDSYEIVCQEITKNILHTCNSILLDLGKKYRRFIGIETGKNPVMRSVTFSSMVFTYDEPLNDILELTPYYGLIINSYGKGEYYNNIEDIYSYYNADNIQPSGEGSCY